MVKFSTSGQYNSWDKFCSTVLKQTLFSNSTQVTEGLNTDQMSFWTIQLVKQID